MTRRVCHSCKGSRPLDAFENDKHQNCRRCREKMKREAKSLGIRGRASFLAVRKAKEKAAIEECRRINEALGPPPA